MKVLKNIISLMVVYLLIINCFTNLWAKEIIKKIEFNGTKYSYVESIDDDGNIRTEYRDMDDNVVDEKYFNIPPKIQVGDCLEQVLEKSKQDSRLVKVNIALQFEEEVILEEPEIESFEIVQGELKKIKINDREIPVADYRNKKEKKEKKWRKDRLIQTQNRKEKIKKWVEKHSLHSKKKEIVNTIQNGYSTITTLLTIKQLKSLIKSQDNLIAGIELWTEGQDTVANAMIDTSITNSALNFQNCTGNNIGIYMTESGCPNANRLTDYDRLSGSETNHSRNVSAIIRAVSPNSHIYCRGSAVLPNAGDLNGVNGGPAIHIITRSNGNNNSTTYNTTDRDWDNYVYDNNIVIFNSAGNEGLGTGNVMSPAKGLNIITVGNYDDANDTIRNSSSFVDPQTGNDKPELCAPGTTINAGGFTMTGTSQSSPHAAGFAADMMSAMAVFRFNPSLVKANMIAGATDNITGVFDRVGWGGIDFGSAFWYGYGTSWTGNNNQWATFDANDGNSDGVITYVLNIPGYVNDVRATIAWLNRGTHAFNNRNNGNSIGMDIDLEVRDPNGNFVDDSTSNDNGFEVVEFVPNVAGNYSFQISRAANNDTACNIRLSLYVNFFTN